jgi:hypothetical protein
MKLFFFLFFTNGFSLVTKTKTQTQREKIHSFSFLKMRNQNPYFVKCSDCKYFVPDTCQDYRVSTENKCTLFGKRNLITGEFTANNVIENRLNATHCGINAVYFEKNPYAPVSLLVAKTKSKIKKCLQKFRMSKEEFILFVFLLPYFLCTVLIGRLILQTL